MWHPEPNHSRLFSPMLGMNIWILIKTDGQRMVMDIADKATTLSRRSTARLDLLTMRCLPWLECSNRKEDVVMQKSILGTRKEPNVDLGDFR